MQAQPGRQLPVIIVGAGGHARVLLDLLERIGRPVLFATDRTPTRLGQLLANVEIRDDEAILDVSPDAVELVNAVGSIATMDARREVCERFRALGYSFATLVHPTATVSPRATLAMGVQILAGVVVQPGAQIGVNSLVNTRASIDHDCIIGDHVHIAPGATLSGAVRVGNATHIGTSATVIQGVAIGHGAMVAAGAVVVRNVEDGQRVAGVPAKPMRKTPPAAAPSPAPEAGQDYGIMVSAVGRRVALSRLLAQSAVNLGLRPRLISTDINRMGAAFHVGDERAVVPRYADPGCLDYLLTLCGERRIRLIIPTIDPDLPFYAAHRDAFRAVGTEVMISSPQTVTIANDKHETYHWLQAQGLPTVRQTTVAAMLDGAPGWEFPVFVKPRSGSSSIGARVVHDRDELRIFTRDGEFVVQELAPGREYTVDVYVDRGGRCLAAVPRLRIETRGGEVVKAMTVRCPPVEEIACRAAESLPGARGAINIQIFHDSRQNATRIIEVNARFGGGYPLTHQAGAPMAQWAIEEALGRAPASANAAWTSGMCMLRYDEAIFVDHHEAGLDWSSIAG